MKIEITDEIKDMFAELINTGVGHAAASLNQLLNYEIGLTVPSIIILENVIELIEYMKSKHSDKNIFVTQLFKGKLSGKGIVMFPVIGGKTLVNLLIDKGDSSEPETFNVIESDAMLEVGNMILNAVQSTISDMSGIEIICGLPQIVLNGVDTLIKEEKENYYIVCEMIFSVKETKIHGMIFLIYTYQNLEILIDKFLK
ncbi:MAG: hypothetical protein HQK78_11860 [Desulfobacterales bacterium]|nr:hypothetical protein [Desulfobacterales bacterium]